MSREFDSIGSFRTLDIVIEACNGGIHLIDVYFKVFGIKITMKGVDKDVSQYLNDFQFDIKVSSGIYNIFHSVKRVLSK